MESSKLVEECLSPESTVTSLLSSSGHLRSSLRPPEINTTIRYRDKDYESATEALDAYITDYERSRHQETESFTGRLVLPTSMPRRVRVSTLRNKDVLRESLTDRELDFLNLPISSLHHRSNRDRLSMTTDELLNIPNDGSMPITHTSAFFQGLLTQSGHPRSCTSFRPEHRTLDRLGRSLSDSRLNHHHQHQHPHPTTMSRQYRGRPQVATVTPDVSSYRWQWAEPSSSLHLPRWFTSNMSDMDCSGISSVPNLKYPAWIQHCDLSEQPPPPTDSKLWEDHGGGLPANARTKAPSWVQGLEEEDLDHVSVQMDSQQTLRDLRLQFAEHISLLAAQRNNSVTETLFRDNRIESLIQKADHVLNSLSQSSRAAGSLEDPTETRTEADTEGTLSESVGPLNMEELHLPLNSAAAAAGSISEALIDSEAQEPKLHGNDFFKQPGPVEALKQMLFRLQAVEAEVQRRAPVAPAEDTLEKRMPESEDQMESFPGGPSLERALHHLNRLKELVKDPKEKCTKDEEEKDEDEGRYSSLSADRLAFTQEKPS